MAATSPGSEPQGVSGGAPAEDAAGAAAPPGGVSTGAAGQGGTGGRPVGESPASVSAGDRDAFDERPEAFVGAAFVGGFALAMILKRVAR
jgi:hypothetical protein